ncbi:Light-independent protochlorophyllide reductase iron-sulfur ATP-binding protein [subsurface metagenome]|nr:AAA family ATPase [Clostridia bacterium]
MKLAITGKGGVGKTTLAAGLALSFSQEGKKVIAIDADPDSNLAATLGFPEPEKIVPLVEMKELIAERTGVEPGTVGGYFKLNPKVDDIPDKFSKEHQGIKLLLMGRVKKGGSGCFCPENAFLKAILSYLFFSREDIVILDMEAGIEHLGRGTAEGVDGLIVVVEPSMRSLETAFRIKSLAKDLKIERVFLVGNKVHSDEDIDFIRKNSSDFEILGFIWYNNKLIDKVTNSIIAEIKEIKEGLIRRQDEREREVHR